MKQPGPRKTFFSLALARYVAALWVVAFHLQPTERESEAVRHLIGAGYVACSFFFVLSGFVLAHSALDTAGRLVGTPGAFLGRRLIRIVPAHAIALVALVTVLAWRHELTWASPAETPGALARCALLVQSWEPHFATSWNFPSWSISVELSFDLLFPLLGPPLARLPLRSSLALVLVLWTLPLFADFAWASARPEGLPIPATGDLAYWHHALRYHPLARLPEFLMGVWVARLMDARSPSDWERRKGAPLALACITLLMLGVTSFGERPYPFTHTLYAPLFAVLIHALASWDHARGPSRLDPFFDMLGDASYPFYIFQIPVALALGAYRPSSFRRWLLCLAALHVVALIVSRAIERPLRARWRARGRS